MAERQPCCPKKDIPFAYKRGQEYVKRNFELLDFWLKFGFWLEFIF